MEKYLLDQSIVEQVRGSGKNGVELRGVVKKIEEELLSKVKVEAGFKGEKESLEGLWLKLVAIGIEQNNLELVIIISAKLKLAQLALTLADLLRRDSALSYSMALAYAANYFRLDFRQAPFDFSSDSLRLEEFEHLLEFYITSCEWSRAFELVKQQFPGHELHPFARLIYHRRAQFREAEEEFESALSDYEAAKAQPSDLVRVIIKQHLDASADILHDYCLARENVHRLLKEYNLSYDYASSDQEQVIPESIRKFIDAQGDESAEDRTNKWLDRKRIEFLGAVVTSSSEETVAKIAQKSHVLRRQNCDLYKALSIDLILGEMSSFTKELPVCTSTIECLSIYNSLPNSSYFLAYFLTTNKNYGNQPPLPVRRKRLQNEYFMACIRLGLVNDSLEELVLDSFVEDKTLEEAISYLLERTFQSDNTSHLDPELQSSTLEKMKRLLEDNLCVTTAVICIVILSASIHLIRLKQSPKNKNNRLSDKLESSFEKLSEYLEEYEFIASDTFVRCTSRLMAVVRDQLDAISDSDIIRNTLRQLVERGAERSLIQGRYRSAAKLYQLVEDRINAVKSLMRLGDVELVINYSLLVRDVTVNRLTVNYLKHLSVDSSRIEDFITKSREQ